MKLILLFTLALIAQSNAAVQDKSNKIWNGSEVTEGNWTNVVAITFEEKFICSGFLIKENVVMTSAHCFDNDDFFYRLQNGTLCKEGFKVHLGTGSNGKYERSVKVIQAIKNEKYNGNRNQVGDDHTDFGILILEEYLSPLEATLIKPISDSEEYEQEISHLLGVNNLLAVGYGMTNDHSFGRKRETALSFEFADDSLVYVKGENNLTGTCSGDSGSPLMMINQKGEVKVMALLASTIANLSEYCGSLSNYVRVDKAVQWANKKLSSRQKSINRVLSHFRFGKMNAKVRNKSLTDKNIKSMMVDDSPIQQGLAYFWVKWGDNNRQYFKVSFQNALKDAQQLFDIPNQRNAHNSSDDWEFWMNLELVGNPTLSPSEEKIFRIIMDCKNDHPLENCSKKVLAKMRYSEIWREYRLSEAQMWHGDQFSIYWRL